MFFGPRRAQKGGGCSTSNQKGGCQPLGKADLVIKLWGPGEHTLATSLVTEVIRFSAPGPWRSTGMTWRVILWMVAKSAARTVQILRNPKWCMILSMQSYAVLPVGSSEQILNGVLKAPLPVGHGVAAVEHGRCGDLSAWIRGQVEVEEYFCECSAPKVG